MYVTAFSYLVTLETSTCPTLGVMGMESTAHLLHYTNIYSTNQSIVRLTSSLFPSTKNEWFTLDNRLDVHGFPVN